MPARLTVGLQEHIFDFSVFGELIYQDVLSNVVWESAHKNLLWTIVDDWAGLQTSIAIEALISRQGHLTWPNRTFKAQDSIRLLLSVGRLLRRSKGHKAPLTSGLAALLQE